MEPALISVRPSTVILDIRVGGRVHKYTIPQNLVHMVNGQMYIVMSRRESSTRRICTLRVELRSSTAASHDDSTRAFAHVTVHDLLAEARDLAIGRLICGEDTMYVANMKKRKKWQTKIAVVPEAIMITTPRIGDIEPVEISVLTQIDGRKGHMPPIIEMTSKAITWMMDAVNEQFMHGGVQSKKVAAATRKRALDITEPMVAFEEHTIDDGPMVDADAEYGPSVERAWSIEAHTEVRMGGADEPPIHADRIDESTDGA
jgi:hypothetical protein